MAEKTLKTRILLKYDSYENWTTNDPILKKGEVAIATIAANSGDVHNAPSVLIKVGDGTNKYSALKFVSGLAADVYAWAKAANKPSYSASEITGLADFISDEIQDTDTQYRVTKTDDYTYVLQSKAKGDADTAYTTVSTINIPKVTIDSALSSTSTNPVQNKVINTALAGKASTAVATTSANGLMSTADKTKLDGIATGAEVNQNAFSNVTIGNTTIAADSKTDTLTIVAGSNVTITPDATNDTITIAAKDTTYADATTTAHGLMTAGDKTKLNGIEAGAQVNTITGVKGDAESAYRTGNVNITAANVGLGNVTNESKATMFTNAALTGTPTAPTAASSTNTTQIATTAFVQSVVNDKIAAADAMIYKGTLGATASSPTVTELPATHKTGWTYKVITAGTYAGAKCEVGDMVVCLTDGTTAKDSDWTVIQTNIDGAVTGPASATANHVAVFDGATGKVIKDSGYTIAKSVPSDAKFTDTTYADATTSAHGLMSTADKTKLDGIATGANKTVVDSAMSTTSTNPVQNKIVNAAITNLDNSLAAIAKSGNINDLVQTSGDVLIFDCGNATF